MADEGERRRRITENGVAATGQCHSDEGVEFDWQEDRRQGRGKSGGSGVMLSAADKRNHGLVCALVSGALGAVSGVVTKLAFDFNSRVVMHLEADGLDSESVEVLQGVGVSLVHFVSDWITLLWASLLPIGFPFWDAMDKYLLLGTPDMLWQAVCESHVGGGVCTVDWMVRACALMSYFVVGAIMLRYYMKSLSLLASAVEATAANFASSFLLSGMLGAVLFREWDDLSGLSIAMWSVGAMSIVCGVWIIGSGGRSPTSVVAPTVYIKTD